MPLDLSSVGRTTKPCIFTYDWRTLATYALGIGAKRDELQYLYERVAGGMKAYPTFGVVPAYEAVLELLGESNTDLAAIVHGAQTIRMHGAIPTNGTLATVGTLKGIYDLKKFAQVIIETTTTTHEGAPVFDTVWSIIVRGAGGFGGKRPPEVPGAVTAPKGREPDWVAEEATLPEQALLYRVSGDANPLHADPEFAAQAGFPQGPILHGLCTYGHVARAIIKHAALGDAAKLRSFSAQFRRPVWPGDTLVTQGFAVGEGKIAVVAMAKGRPEPVLTNAWAEIG